MNRKVIRNVMAALVVVVAVAWSLYSVLRREIDHATDDAIVIRFAHPLLDDGFRAAMKELCSEYEDLQATRGRKVKIVPMEIPQNVYPQWSRTQLIGETAPEIMMLSWEVQRDVELVARYFRSLGEDVSQPNPYNKGTILEGQRWRDTFIDGMRISGYIFRLADHYGIPLSVTTNRLLANRRLLKEILSDPANAELAREIGPSLVPKNFRQFIALCDAVEPWSERTGHSLFPIAADRQSGRILLDFAIGSQNQKLMFSWPPLENCNVRDSSMLVRMEKGLPIWSHPAFRQGLELMREIGLRMQPGYMQLRTEDANFAFATERALMILVSSLDASSLRSMTDGRIDTVAFAVPFPDIGDPHYCKYSLGPLSEADIAGNNPFGVVNYSTREKQEVALDFLQFLSSWRANKTFTEISGLLPAIAEVEPGKVAAPFAPRVNGYRIGPPLHMSNNDLRTLVDRYLYTLVSPRGGVDEFLRVAVPALKKEELASIKRGNDANYRTQARLDPLIDASIWLQTFAPDTAGQSERKLSILVDSSDGNETDAAMRESRLQAFMESRN